MRSKDRLAELQRLAASGGGGGGGGGGGAGDDDGCDHLVYRDTVEPVGAARAGGASGRGPDIDNMFRDVERMRGWIHELEGYTQLIRRLHSDPTFHTNKQLQEQLDSAVTMSHGVGLKVSGALRQFEGVVAAAGNSTSNTNTAGARIARLQYACTRALYADALARHHAALDALRQDHLALLHEQIKLTNVTISDEECQSLLDSRNLSLFVDNVAAETAEARRALREAEARHEELARVEAALRDVRDLFQQLAHLVAAQQEQIDSVEYYALQATDHVETGQHHLLKGTVSRTKARKKKLSLIICLCAGFALVLMVLFLT